MDRPMERTAEREDYKPRRHEPAQVKAQIETQTKARTNAQTKARSPMSPKKETNLPPSEDRTPKKKRGDWAGQLALEDPLRNGEVEQSTGRRGHHPEPRRSRNGMDAPNESESRRY